MEPRISTAENFLSFWTVAFTILQDAIPLHYPRRRTLAPRRRSTILLLHLLRRIHHWEDMLLHLRLDLRPRHLCRYEGNTRMPA